MKKDIKFIALFYLGVVLFAYTFTFIGNNNTKIEGSENQSRSMVIKLK